MRAMVVRRYGPPEMFELREMPDPKPSADQCLIRVRAAGINFADLLQRMGIYPGTPKPPFIPGFEVAGVVEQAPPGAACKAGDRVVGVTRFNAYAELSVCAAQALFLIPSNMSFEEAAAVPVNYLTA